MKKLLAFLLAACISLFLAVPAFADGRGPAFTSYDVVCTKETPYFRENWDKDGVMEKKGSFPSGTVLTVDYEYEKDGVLYGNVNIGNDEDWEWAYIRVADVNLKDDTYLPENAQKLSRPRSVRVIGEDGVSMYTGPNTKYEKLITIPRGTKLTYRYGNDEEDYYRTWAYVSFLGKNGWIYVYATDTKNGLAELPDEGDKAEVWALEDGVQMFAGMSFGNMENELGENFGVEVIRENHEAPDRVIGTLEKGKKYTYRYSHAQDYGTWYYVVAGLRAGWVFMSDENSRVAATTTASDQDYFMAYKTFKLKLREAPRENASGTTVSIPKDTVLRADYKARSYQPFYYATIDGQSGWYSDEDARNACAYKVNNTYHGYWNKNESEKSAPIYSDILQAGKTVGKLPAGSLFTPLYYGSYEKYAGEEDSSWVYFYYVQYNDVTGWVKEEDLWDPDAEGSSEETEEYTEDEWDEEEEAYEPDDAFETDDEEAVSVIDVAPVPAQSGNSALRIVLICVAAAVVLALTAAVTLILIRRKRGAKPSAEAAAAESVKTEPDMSEQKETAREDAPAEDIPPTDEA